MKEIKGKPDYIFEVSWEVCNKIGGIHTVISTKALSLKKAFGDNIIYIGPDLWNENNPCQEFKEDLTLFKEWKLQVASCGINVKIGRWLILGNPLAILIDFKSLIPRKDEIFTHLWEVYRLESLNAEWEFVEAALFGYASGIVIESFIDFQLSDSDIPLAHFHEWMSGTGCLYIEMNSPEITTIFTTHATMMGRVLASNYENLYANLVYFDAKEKAEQYNVISKCSLEKSAAIAADCLTTVSHITSWECRQFYGRPVNMITPNGFEEDLIPSDIELEEKRNIARQSFKRVAEALFGYQLPADTLFIGTSGRYEYKNKGIDIFLESLAKLNLNKSLNREIVAFLFIPGDPKGPRQDLLENIKHERSKTLSIPYVTHYLGNTNQDPILNKIQNICLKNTDKDKVKVILCPTYLNGEDGIFNLSYYNLLVGLDLSVFPSYYEPWGYTPHESIAFKVPTITTTLAGFGKWVNKTNGQDFSGVEVLERTDLNTLELIKNLSQSILSFSRNSEKDLQVIRNKAQALSKKALWKNFINYYLQAYEIAMKNNVNRNTTNRDTNFEYLNQQLETPKSNQVSWRKLFIGSNLPESIKGLEELSMNIWWSWNYHAIDLFKFIDPILWHKCNKNPILLLKQIPSKRLIQLVTDDDFIKKYNHVYQDFKDYLAVEPEIKQPKIAYFSMEYGLNDNLKIYSGGLGILAGDYLKEASDSNINMIGIGLMYRFGYFTQSLSLNGEQQVTNEEQKLSHLPITQVRDSIGLPITISIEIANHSVDAIIYRVNVGRIPLYLLDTNIETNSEEDKAITHQLYSGNWDNRIKQEIILGMGGIRTLNALDIHPDLYHCNEGHAALINVELLTQLCAQSHNFSEALEIVRTSSLFTTHTPVPAGHDTFEEGMIRHYLAHIPSQLGINWEQFLSLGRVNPKDHNEKFSMSNLAANTSHQMNGVSWLHGKVSRQIFNNLYAGYFPEELHIDYVTNGVHYPTWTAKEWRSLYESEFPKNFIQDQSNSEHWEKIYDVDDEKIWEIRQELRKNLIYFVKNKFRKSWIRRYEDPRRMLEIIESINENALTIGFARRFATYKRAHLLFSDLNQLSKLVNNPERPIQFIFAGKAHPADKAGQDLIKNIVKISRRPEFAGKILFLENYDIELGKRLVKGVDIWMNTPTRPLEASGTSGEKAVMNGVLNFSVLDGWWMEGYKKEAGWAITEKRTYESQDLQDQLDAKIIYSKFENEIIPLFYDREDGKLPIKWIQYIKKCIAEIAPHYTTKRMMDDYNDKFYSKMYEKVQKLKENNFQLAKNIVNWKQHILSHWDNIEVISVDAPNTQKKQYIASDNYNIEVVLDLKELINDSICVELVMRSSIYPENLGKILTRKLVLNSKVNSLAFYKLNLTLDDAGVFDFGLRIYAENNDLPHRQDFCYVKWI
ncbi:alpha-glucan family phosphorylase [Ancylomarina euxinus]|uniref:Alpha-glucan family phosphorylase n=1 Tax=Ancylomarina euxinus TaxID=2283627 RepID=A0A425Y076_9BACT|nr:alpha-glucan family phosphorylase [Ancylomarina euxinus]MCZ4695231.1 alpha-glucan family phosphorylase [Ancylomarina euxinus]MUP15428.1 alpha-glucan family phosphorylase [Ancylomarina euxinus]RRG21138.1 alpha-glucan family phosphorylase [Ancylomarina euxinus]